MVGTDCKIKDEKTGRSLKSLQKKHNVDNAGYELYISMWLLTALIMITCTGKW